MVKIGLQFKADLDNITNLHPEGDDFRWYIKFKCLNCGEETHDFTYLTLTESTPVKGGRGKASLVLKCRLCLRENSVDIIPESYHPYNIEDSGKFKTVVAFDCRGIEPTDFSPRVGFAADSSFDNGVNFQDISLTEKDWSDYDEKAKATVGIYDVTHQFKKLK
ncbi:CXXC motif containing zinc binding protein-like [Lineus longissimus]|uniref:CXXC motif containing zinc binding protein-like n=1 Tax=Lineus longissimus TaxID=88925 RepID=UPI002B4CDA49